MLVADEKQNTRWTDLDLKHNIVQQESITFTPNIVHDAHPPTPTSVTQASHPLLFDSLLHKSLFLYEEMKKEGFLSIPLLTVTRLLTAKSMVNLTTLEYF